MKILPLVEDDLKIGAVFPQNEVGDDIGAVRSFAQAAEDLGYDYLVYYDHVLGADTSGRPKWTGPYTHLDSFHEPLVTFGYLAAITKTIELTTTILILPQRQTALVAKQAAQVDALCNGRLRLGIGVGWNEVEFEALGENFSDRGKRSEEQIELLRLFWTNEIVDYQGKWHRVDRAGLRPMPVQRPIPIWFGGGKTDTVLRRIARLGDGWMPQVSPNDQGKSVLDKFKGYVLEANRKIEDVGIDARVRIANGFEQAAIDFNTWKDWGATHIAANSLHAGLKTVDEHIKMIEKFRELVN